MDENDIFDRVAGVALIVACLLVLIPLVVSVWRALTW